MRDSHDTHDCDGEMACDICGAEGCSECLTDLEIEAPSFSGPGESTIRCDSCLPDEPDYEYMSQDYDPPANWEP